MKGAHDTDLQNRSIYLYCKASISSVAGRFIIRVILSQNLLNLTHLTRHKISPFFRQEPRKVTFTNNIHIKMKSSVFRSLFFQGRNLKIVPNWRYVTGKDFIRNY